MTDYISRDEAIEALGEMPLNWTDSPEELQEVADWEEHLHAIMAIPAPDVRPVVRGRWRFEKGDGKTCNDGWVCSACNCGYHTNVPYFGDFNFCPHCGADMTMEATE